MPELRLFVIASLTGDPESVVEEHVVEYEEGAGLAAAEKAGGWLRKLADALVEGARDEAQPKIENEG